MTAAADCFLLLAAIYVLVSLGQPDGMPTLLSWGINFATMTTGKSLASLLFAWVWHIGLPALAMWCALGLLAEVGRAVLC